MAFPATALAVKTELNLNGTWTDISSYTLTRSGFAITRGRRSEGSTSDPSTCNFSIRNADGRFSPRNPTGPYYGSIGRNTQVRVSLPASTSYLSIPATTTGGNYASCPDDARIDITSDLDVRIDAWFSTIGRDDGYDLIGKYTVTGNQRSYGLRMEPGGYPALFWSTNGTAVLSVTSNYPVPAPVSGRRAIRATLDVNNGSGGYTVTFYTSDTISGSWTQLDQTVTTSGTTSIHNSTSPLYVGDIAGSSTFYTNQQWLKVYAAQVLNGIGGSASANPDFTAQTDGVSSFADAAGNTWTVAGSAAIVGRDYRFHGEISEWPGRWDHSGRDVSVPVTASGILRRLGKGSKPLRSAYFRGVAARVAQVSSVVAYWPCEDAQGATSVASGIPGRSAMTISGTPTLASDSTSFPCSAALPDMGTGAFSGNVASYASTGQIQVRMLLAIPAAGITNSAVLFSVRCGGTAVRWELVYTTASGGTMTLNAYDAAGSSLLSTGASFNLTGARTRIGLSLTQSGANVNYSFESLTVGSTIGSYLSGTLNSQTITSAHSVTLAPNRDCSGATMGHATVQSAVTSLFDLDDQLNAYAGETATDRFLRLCGEESITAIAIGDTASTTLMGPQTQQTLVNLLRECEAADGGIIYEPRDFFGLAYRSVQGLADQSAALTLDYATSQLSDLEPTEDDQTVLNDVTVTRSNGSSARVTNDSGILSTQDPPNGVGVYDTSVTLNAYADSQLDDLASWRVHLGTVDEPRYPSIGVNLAHPTYAASASLTLAAESLDVGDRLVIQNPPAWFPPEDISQLVIGFTETLAPKEWDISYTCVPESPYHLAVYGAASRYSSQGTTVVGAHTAPVSTLIVTTPGGPVWSHADGDYDVMVSGSRFTVTAVGTPEIIPNTGFEASTSDWWGNGGTLTRDTGQHHSGVASGKLVTGAGAAPRIESGGNGTYPVTPGEVVTASVWLRADTARGLRLDIDWFDSSSVFVSRDSSAVTTVTANTWTQFTLTATCPVGCAGFDIAGVNDGTPGAGLNMWLDDATATTDRRQSFTVTLVNGISKNLANGAEVSLFDPNYYIA